MTVQELVDALSILPNKNMQVAVSTVDSRGNEIIGHLNNAYMTFRRDDLTTEALVLTELNPYEPVFNRPKQG